MKHPFIASQYVPSGQISYFHPMDDNHLIAPNEINGDYVNHGITSLGMYDISDPADLKQINHLDFSLSDHETECEVNRDYHAFFYDPSLQITSLPFYGHGEDGEPLSLMVVFKTSVENGISKFMEIDHSWSQGEAGSNFDYYANVPRRSLVLNGALFTISDLALMATDTVSWNTVSAIELPWIESN